MLYLLIILSFWLCWVNSLQLNMNLLELGVPEFTGQPQLFRYDWNNSLPCIMQISGPGRLMRLPGQEQDLDQESGSCLNNLKQVSLILQVPISLLTKPKSQLFTFLLHNIVEKGANAVISTYTYTYTHMYTLTVTVTCTNMHTCTHKSTLE